MKTYEEFATEKTTDPGFASLLKEAFTKELIKEVEPLLVGKQILAEDTLLVGTGGVTREFRKRSATSAGPFGECEAVFDADPAVDFSVVQCTPTKFGASETLSEDIIDAADFNIINEKKSALADAMARFGDARVWNEVLDANEVLLEDHLADAAAEIQLDNYPLLEVTSVIDSDAVERIAECEVDYLNGWIKIPQLVAEVIDDVSYVYIDDTDREVIGTTAAGVISFDDLMFAKRNVLVNKYIADTAVFEPVGVTQITLDDKFLESESTAPKVLLNGQIGRAAGLSILLTHQLYEGVCFVCKRGKDLGYYVYKRKITSRMDTLETMGGCIWIGTWEKSIPCVVNDEALCIIVGGATNAYVYSP